MTGGGVLAVTRFSTARDFLEAAKEFLSANEVENNLILGISMDLAADSSGLMEHPYFAVVTRAGEVCMAGFGTIPGKLAITAESVPGATFALSRDVHEAIPHLDSILGPEATVDRFAREFAALRGLRAEVRMRQRIHELVRVETLPGLPNGTLRQAGPDDTALIGEWLRAFHTEIGEAAPTSRTATYRVSAGELFLWDDNGPRSMAGWSGPTPNGIRVNAVYTPPELRGKGYATATVAALSQRLLVQGCRFCCLYTDLANPTSNAIYKRIGYHAVSDSAVYSLVSRAP